MLKRTKGRILLTMLVITGLAGTVNNSTLSNQERKFVISQLKDTRADLLSTIKNLSEKQLNFKPSPGKWSVRECISHIIFTEKVLWNNLQMAMKESAVPEKRLELTLSDKDLLWMPDDGTTNAIHSQCHQSPSINFESAAEELAAFKSIRAAHLKYVKTTTEDLRNHFIRLPIGWVDCYQSIIFMSGHSNRHIGQINEILADPHFPKK
jgi:DinB superfamily